MCSHIKYRFFKESFTFVHLVSKKVVFASDHSEIPRNKMAADDEHVT